MQNARPLRSRSDWIVGLVRRFHRQLTTAHFFRRPRVFISYRREDLPEVAALAYRAVAQTGSAFLDVDAIAAGDDFLERIRRFIGASDLVIAIVGPRWIGPRADGTPPRIQNENDFVRLELEEAVRAAKPLAVLHWGPSLPAAALPDSLARVRRSKWTNVSERELGQVIEREVRRVRRPLSWGIPVAVFVIQAAVWVAAAPMASAIYGEALQREDSVHFPTSTGSSDGGTIDNPVFVSITAGDQTYVMDEEVPLTLVSDRTREALDRCLPACYQRVLIRGDVGADPAIVFGVVRQLQDAGFNLGFVVAPRD